MIRIPLAVVAAAACLAAGSIPSMAFELALPIACTIGEDCAIQNYFDRDPGKDESDYMCGHQTYDGHDGIDFRISSLQAMAAGVAVLAAADGTVKATRDGMADQSIADADPSAVKDRECGNGVVIEHADGWVTQYCHMKDGSISVRKGDVVTTGTRLGEVGLSGMTEFPHVHLSVRKDGKKVDPFALEPLGAGARCNFAGDAATSLWAPNARAALAYRPAFVLNAGFADAAVEIDQVESGKLEGVELKPDSTALVFYGLAIGIETGDIQRIEIYGPDGQLFAENELEPVDRPKAQYFAFTGKKRHDQPWPSGTWRGRYSIIRDGKEVAFREAKVDIVE